MNLLEHYIQEVYSIKDVTEEWEKLMGRKANESFVKVKMCVNCYGQVSITEKIFCLSEWEQVKSQGYYLA